MIGAVYRPQGKEETMNKIIRDRIVFAVVACIAMAAIIFYCNAQPKAAHLPQDLREMMGEEADASFSSYFTALQDWYDNQTVTENGVTFSDQAQFEEITQVLSTLVPFLVVYEQELSEAEFMQVQEYIRPMLNFTMAYLSILEVMSSGGSYPFSAAEWSELGTTISYMTDYYRLP